MTNSIAISKDSKEELEAIAKEHRLKMKQTYPIEYKSSIAPILT